MNKFFYGKLAVANLKKNAGLYLPYFFTAVGMIMVFYIMNAITTDPGIRELKGAEYVQMIMVFGNIVVGIFGFIFLLYTNSFLMKRRKKEFGLYNILGMEKRHITRMMLCETCIVAFVSLLIGLLCGVVFYKIVVLLLLRLSGLSVPFGFQIFAGSLATTFTLFGIIFFITLIYNMRQIHLAKPIELLQSKNQGEREPKTRWLLAIIGAAALLTGYFIAITRENPLEVIFLFFVAVLLVMLGTYFLFTAGSVAVLKLMRKNKNYYYKTSHFTSVSGMIYRMKQNAVGLANICILSTAVLVMISATVCLYAGSENVIRNLYPADINVRFAVLNEENKVQAKDEIEKIITANGQKVLDYKDYRILGVSGVKTEDGYEFSNGEQYTGDYSNVAELQFVTAQEFERVTGTNPGISDDEVQVFAIHGAQDAREWVLGDKKYKIAKYLNNDDVKGFSMRAYVMIMDSYLIVLPSQADLDQINALQKQAYGKSASQEDYEAYIDITGTEEEKKACIQAVRETLQAFSDSAPNGQTEVYIRTEGRAENEGEMRAMYGGFLFLGIFLGFVFMMATVLIIYYKQISEGYEDKERFEIMQKVGMSTNEVRRSIRSQILKVFFLPLVTAGIHVLAAFPMIKRLLLLFGMSNTTLFLTCTVITILVFGVIYALVYGLTARTYYKIVK